MILAIPYENGNVFQHFGQSEAFKLYEINDGNILDSRVVSTNGDGHGALAGLLREWNVSALICGGIGGGAKNALNKNNIEIFSGVTGIADQVVAEYLSGNLLYQADATCNHHGHGHTCNHHDSTCDH